MDPDADWMTVSVLVLCSLRLLSPGVRLLHRAGAVSLQLSSSYRRRSAYIWWVFASTQRMEKLMRSQEAEFLTLNCAWCHTVLRASWFKQKINNLVGGKLQRTGTVLWISNFIKENINVFITRITSSNKLKLYNLFQTLDRHWLHHYFPVHPFGSNSDVLHHGSSAEHGQVQPAEVKVERLLHNNSVFHCYGLKSSLVVHVPESDDAQACC